MAARSIALVAGLLLVTALLVGTPAGADHERLSEEARIALAHLDLEEHEARVTDEYTSGHNGVTHVYLRQLADGVQVVGAEATVNVQDGQVIHAGSRIDPAIEESGQAVLTEDDAAEAAALAVEAGPGDAVSEPELVYLALGDGTARLAYRVHVQVPQHWWNLAIDAETGAVLHQEDWVDEHDAVVPQETADDGSSYLVYPIPMESPNDGDRQVVHNPAHAGASPFGWHDTNGVVGPEFSITRGNNVNAYADTAADNVADPMSQPDGGPGLDFAHDIPTFDATPAVYRDAAVDNLFYGNNVMHDVTHAYGFTEEAGNFQASNYTGTGRGGDAVLAEAQDGSFVLNANFATPPEGEPGRMQMFLWVDAFETLGLGPEDVAREYSHQVRDGDLDNGVVFHEYGHGVSNRLVGGPSNVSCLRTHDEREGEGWSDFWSYALTVRPGDDGATPRGIGTYVIYQDEGREQTGIRPTAYSTDMAVNPATYADIEDLAEPHGVGYVWATMLWDLYWNLVEEHGFNPAVYDAWDTGGNNLAIQLVVDGMKFVPCEPGFADARDAIIAADAALTGNAAEGMPGENECLIWETFARRGLGLSASQGDFERKDDSVEGYDVPEHCPTG